MAQAFLHHRGTETIKHGISSLCFSGAIASDNFRLQIEDFRFQRFISGKINLKSKI